jgi:hypothetical protein
MCAGFRAVRWLGASECASGDWQIVTMTGMNVQVKSELHLVCFPAVDSL